MRRSSRSEAAGFTVGDRLSISCGPFDARIHSVSATRVFIEWPWREKDPSSRSWDGTMGFPRDPDHWEWRNTPWRVEPDPLELQTDDLCMVGIPPTEVQVIAIDAYEPPADFGWTPRPALGIGLCPVTDLDIEEAGYVIYPESGDPVEIEHLGGG
jgi:hypothetical protein